MCESRNRNNNVHCNSNILEMLFKFKFLVSQQNIIPTYDVI